VFDLHLHVWCERKERKIRLVERYEKMNKKVCVRF
jgi:hypothetical protein